MDEARLRTILFVCGWSVNPNEIPGELLTLPSMGVRIVNVKCTGRIEPSVVLESFLRGFDGVLIVGCEPKNCHFVEGNLHAERKVKMLRRLLELAGFHPERLDLKWSSAADEGRFMAVVQEFANRIGMLGSSPLSGDHFDPGLQERMLAAKATVEDFRVRSLVGKELELTEKGNVYGEQLPQIEFDEVEEDALETEFLRHRIRLLLRTPLSVKELSNKLSLDARIVLSQIVALQQIGVVQLDRIEGTTPLYRAWEAQ